MRSPFRNATAFFVACGSVERSFVGAAFFGTSNCTATTSQARPARASAASSGVYGRGLGEALYHAAPGNATPFQPPLPSVGSGPASPDALSSAASSISVSSSGPACRTSRRKFGARPSSSVFASAQTLRRAPPAVKSTLAAYGASPTGRGM